MKKLFTFDTAGQVGNNPRTVRLLTDATLSEVTAPGFVSQEELAPNALYSTDAILAIIGYNFETQSGGALALLNPTISGDVITISEANTGSEVQLPVVVGRLAVFTNLSGQIGDPFVTASHVGPLYLGQSGTAGYLRSYSATPSSGAFTFQGEANSGNFFCTLKNAAFGQNTSIVIPDPATANAKVSLTTAATTANRIATYANADGGLAQNAAVAINGGDIQAGLSGTAGKFTSYATAPTSGSLSLAAVANSGDFAVNISNVAMGQASTISIPDPASATANFLVTAGSITSGHFAVATGGSNGAMQDSGAAIHSNTYVWAGGSATHAFTVTGMAPGLPVTCTINAQSNAASIVQAVPGTDTVTVTFSADPGAATVITISWASAAY